MQKLYFIRHGQSETNVRNQWAGHIDTPLTEEGHKQAEKAGQKARKQGLSFDIIVSSPLQRAHHTAKHVAAHIEYPRENIVLHDIVKERAYGILEGKFVEEALALYKQKGEAGIDHFEGVESLQAMHERAQQALRYLQSLPHENVLVVAHGAFGRALTRVVRNQPPHVYEVRYQNAELVRLI